MKYNGVRQLILIVPVLFAISSARSLADDATLRRFKSEYATVASVLNQRLATCTGEFKVSMLKQSPASVIEVQFFRSNGFEKCEVNVKMNIGGKNVSGVKVYSLNEDSFFAIERLDEQPKFQLKQLHGKSKAREQYHLELGRFIKMPLGGTQKSLIQLLNDKEIDIETAHSLQNNPKIVEATFEVNNGTPIKRITAQFDTNNHWAVVHQTIEAGSPTIVSADYDIKYGPMNDGVAMPAQITVKGTSSPIEFGEWRFVETPRDAFLLPHYGLPDLIAAQQKSGYNWIKLGILAVVLILTVIGIGFYFLSVKRANKLKVEV